MQTWLWVLSTAELWSEGSTTNCWRGRASTSPWWPCRAKETRLWTRKLDKVGRDFGQSVFSSPKSLLLDDWCPNWDRTRALILSLGLVADKEEEVPERLSRAGSYRASLRYYTRTLVSHCLQFIYNCAGRAEGQLDGWKQLRHVATCNYLSYSRMKGLNVPHPSLVMWSVQLTFCLIFTD